MDYIHVHHRGDDECMVHIGGSYRDYSSVKDSWCLAFNASYVEDIRKINAFLNKLPSRVDDRGREWVRHNFECLKSIIHHIVRARVQARVPMLFLGHHTRRTILTFACARLLPQDLLREIAAWAHFDETSSLVRLFTEHVVLLQITGLYLCIEGLRYPVNEIRWFSLINYPESQIGWTCELSGYDKRYLCLAHHQQCARQSTPHLCVLHIDLLLFRVNCEIKLNDKPAFVARFEAAEAIEFEYKKNPQESCGQSPPVIPVKLNHNETLTTDVVLPLCGC